MYRFLIHPDQIYCKCNRKVHYDVLHVGWKIIDVVLEVRTKLNCHEEYFSRHLAKSTLTH